jgi:hypothetical protein
MKSNNAVLAVAVVLAVAATMAPDLAFAQAGGSGQAQGLLNWVVQSIGRPMLNGGILLVAFFLLCARVGLGTVGMVAAGGLVFANYEQIAGFFGF